VHNTRTILTALRQDGEQIWSRFNGGKQGTLWYYRSLVEIFEEIYASPMVPELARVVDEMGQIARS
jgi:hypothetical protein